jgi:hypothetical protein
LAVLTSEDGRKLEIPAAWLPNGAESGTTFRAATAVELGTRTTEFTVRLERLEQGNEPSLQ